MTLSGATTPDQSNGKEEVLCIPLKLQHWRFAIRLFVISAILVGREVLPLCRDVVSVFFSPCQLGSLFIGLY